MISLVSPSKKLSIFTVADIFLKGVGLWLDLDWIVNPFWKKDLDCQSYICDGFGLDWQSKKLDWAKACSEIQRIRFHSRDDILDYF